MNIDFESIRRTWLTNIRANVLAGIVVALALIPEAIGFSLIAGVDPRVGLYASVVIAIVISFAGGRPAMISAATAATAVLFGALVRDHGLQYLLAATILAGLIQIIAGWLRVGYIMGSGDDGALALRQMGVDVDILTPEQVQSGDYSAWNTLVLGVRVYETRPDVAAVNDRIAVSRPEPGPLTNTSTFLTPCSCALRAAFSAASWAAKGVDLREPLKPT